MGSRRQGTHWRIWRTWRAGRLTAGLAATALAAIAGLSAVMVKPGRRVVSGVLAAASAVALGVAMMSAAAGPAAAVVAGGRKFRPPAVQKVRVLPRRLARIPGAGAAARGRVSAAVAAALKAGDGVRPESAWPAAGSGTAVLPVVPAGLVSGAVLRAAERPAAAGGLPVTVARAGAAAVGVSQVRVRMLGHGAAVEAGVAGVLFDLTGSGTAAGPVRVSVGYGSFRNAGSAGWADRLRVVELPGCVLTSPRVPACQVQTPLRTVSDAAGLSVSATADLVSRPALASLMPSVSLASSGSLFSASSQVVLAAVSGTSGSNGTFAATSLKPSGTWAVGGSSGSFTWSYPITVPPPAAGSAPKVSLGYDSASVDGKTAQTNNQSSEVGEGFSLDSNFIERSYADCADDPGGSVSGKYDLCWAGNVVTLSLNGVSTPLVYDSSTGSWQEQNDHGDRVQFLTGTSANTGNGTYDNGYWVVTTPDGTQYFFGKNKGPGWSSGDPVTNSAWTVPVYGAHSGDPCYSSSGFADSSCLQAWRWNLDFVIGPNGNSSAYYYTPETNYYGADNLTTGVKYTRGGYLTKIEYGLRYENSSLYGSLDANAPDEVVFGTAQRCIPTSTFSCSASDFTTANAQYWPDTPVDLLCTASQTCNNHAPSFWSQMRIDAITTQYWNGSKYVTVDKYAFGQSFPTSGDPELMLDTITRTGYSASGSSLALPPVDLAYQLMNNRIPGYNNEPDMAHWRLTNIETETGEIIDVTYSLTCTASEIPSSPSSNNTLCYPIYWTPVGDTSPILDYFNKYVVDEVSVQDGTAGDPSQVTQYDYVGSPAWHYDDNQVVLAKYRTYGQFRGYGTVDVLSGNTQNVTNGTPDVQTETETTYYRGMYGDTLPGGGTSTTQVSDSLKEKLNDYNALAGLPLEVQTFDGASGGQLTDKISEWSVTKVTGSETVSGLPTVQASMTGVTSERDFTDLPGGGQQELLTTTTYDGDGRAVLVDKSGTSIPRTCTQTSYDDNTTKWIRDAVYEVIVSQQACPSSTGKLTASDIVSDTRTYYDGATSLTAGPSAGNPTMQAKAVTNTSGTLSFATQWTKTYDAMGRVLTSTDGRGNLTSTAYTPAVGGPLTAQAVTNALSQVSTQTFDPGRRSVLTAVTAAGYETSASYDPLGRVTAVWKAGRSQSAGAAANVTYSYKVSQSAPLAVTTNTLVDTGSATDYVTSVSIYDSLGQLRQTQTAAEGGDTAVTGTFYDSHGWTWQTNNKYVVTGSPSTSLVSVAESAVNDRTIDSYNGAGQQVEQLDYNGDTLVNSTQTVRGGDQVTTIRHDASGNVMGTPHATVTNMLGQHTETIQYASAPAVSGNAVSGGSPQVTTMTYDAAGNQIGVSGPAGTWSYAYNLLGQKLQASDANSGTTTTTYDAAGNVASQTDANGTQNYVYDQLNRKVAEYTGSTTQGQGTEVAAWVWDTLKKGLLSYEKSFTSAGTYETGNLGYDSYGNPSGTWVYVPSGHPLAGTHETRYTYSSTGLLLYELPASGGGLPADSLAFTYDSYGNPVTETGYDVYVSGAIWTPYKEISQIELGTGPSAAALTYSYDPRTRDVTGINLSDNQPSPQVDNTAYTYNADQQVTQITDTQGAAGTAPTETQCFSYDGLSRLTQAWSSTDNCAASPATAGNATVGGPQPYWQSWTFSTAGDILTQVSHAPAGSTAGDQTMTYSYQAPGHPNAVSSITTANSATGAKSTTSFAYNNAGQTTNLGGMSLLWNYNATLASDGPVSYIYNADGSELEQASGTSATLFLPGEQLTEDTTTGTITGMRYYSFAGKIIAETTGSTLYWAEQNTQGSLTTAVNAFNQSATPDRRTLSPYGVPLTGSTGTWPDQRTFLNDPYNSATGLIDIGARKYNPATATFISVDPVLDTSSPQTMNGYTYAAANPIDNTDPTGKMLMMSYGGFIGTWQYLMANAAAIARAIQASYVPPWHPQYTPVYVPHYTPPPPARHMQRYFTPSSLSTPFCAGWGCTEAKLGKTAAAFGRGVYNLARNFGGVTEMSGVARTLSRIGGTIGSDAATMARARQASMLVTEGSVFKSVITSPSKVGLALAGGAIGAYSEYNSSHGNWGKTVTVGVADVGVGLAASWVSGAIAGAAAGSAFPVVGTIVGAAVGAAIGYFGSNLVSNIVNSSVYGDVTHGISSVASDIASWF